MIRNALAMLATLLIGIAPPPQAPSTLIRGAWVFDGTGAPATIGDVLVTGDRIAAVAPHLKAPRGARTIDARGATLLPGLHDLHTHARAPGFPAPDDLGKAYAAYLANGVTRTVDFSLSGEMLAPIREMAGSGAVAAPRLALAVRLGVPGGHGTEYGWGSFFTLEVATPRAAHAAMARALAYRPDVIKVFADGWRYGRSPDLGSMNVATLSAIVADAHAAGLPVITHTVTLAGAKMAAAAGVDALGHGIGDALADDELIAAMRAHGTAYIPTLVVYEPQQDRTFTQAEWRAMRPPERAREAARGAGGAQPIPALEARRWTIMQDNVRRLHAAGIPIGVGTDAGIGGVYHGGATIREIALLARLGLTPAEALTAATATSAHILRSTDHGRIAVGQRADLLLVRGRPDRRVDDLRNVRRVFVAGREVGLKPLRRMLDSDEPSPLPVHRMTGPIDTGIRNDGRTDLDTLPVDASEPGVDHSTLDLARPGKALFLVARLGSARRPYAQLIVPLTRGGIQLADARGFAGVAFTARGRGRYALALDSYGQGDRLEAAFDAGDTAAQVRIPFTAFVGKAPARAIDLTRLRALVFRLDGTPGARAWLQLEDLRFYREGER
ncbi:amidohydrolase family protein [Sphingomonas sp.]|jgi:imidazolonepropionase-like amidohydrolase|uniref:amidohydrolase family protein n=1 Tax=Sphingomonas sp. TaxID=28214 RepID=UPI002EDA53BF